MITVCDREGDFWDLLAYAVDDGDALLLRAGRGVKQSVRTEDGRDCLWEHVAGLAPVSAAKLTIPSADGPRAREERDARLEIRAARIELMPPGRAAALAPADHRVPGRRRGRLVSRLHRAGLASHALDDRDLVQEIEDRDQDQEPTAGRGRRPREVPVLRRNHRLLRRRPVPPRPGEAGDTGDGSLSGGGRRPAGGAGLPECGADGARAAAGDPQGGHRHRALGRLPSLEEAAIAGCEKGLAGARAAELGDPVTRYDRHQKAGIGPPDKCGSLKGAYTGSAVAYDVWDAEETLTLVREAAVSKDSLESGFVINRKTAITVMGRDVRTALVGFDTPVLNSAVSQRVAFAECAAAVRAVIETRPNSPANREIQMLADEVLQIHGR